MNSDEVTAQFEPTFVKMDRQVLRFFGYFREAVVESALEHYRLRKLVIYYYLEDHTLSIIEPKQTNSGTPQGAFLKRQSVLKEDRSGICILPQDIRVGSNISIYGKNIRVYDCDQYTREFYEHNGQAQGRSEPVPSDAFEVKTTTKEVKVRDQAMKDFLEKSLGGGRPKNQKQFLDNDRKVLRFYCKSGENYILHFYLADDTIEILECHYPNDGRIEFPILLRRMKLPKRFGIGQPGQVPISEYLQEYEIEPNMTLTVYGREFVIDSADEFTADYYRRYYSKVFPVGPVPEPAPLEVSPVVIPPHDGLGSEEDSLGYIYRLIPKAPHKDYFKFIDNSHKILRWVGKFNSPQPEDVERRFVIMMYLNDDTLQINEMPQRNSGFQEGKFLARGKYKNSARNSDPFHPVDFLIGSDVVINSFRFHIESCDDYTKKWMLEKYQKY